MSKNLLGVLEATIRGSSRSRVQTPCGLGRTRSGTALAESPREGYDFHGYGVTAGHEDSL